MVEIPKTGSLGEDSHSLGRRIPCTMGSRRLELSASAVPGGDVIVIATSRRRLELEALRQDGHSHRRLGKNDHVHLGANKEIGVVI